MEYCHCEYKCDCGFQGLEALTRGASEALTFTVSSDRYGSDHDGGRPL